MHDIALQGTANFCGTQTSSLGSWAVARRFVCGMIRFNNCRRPRCMTSGDQCRTFKRSRSRAGAWRLVRPQSA